MAKTKYLKQSEIEEIEHILYNDLPLLDHYNVSSPVVDFDEDSFKKVLKKGEKWAWCIDPLFDEIIITSFGRVFNMVTTKQLSIRINAFNIHSWRDRNRIPVRETFELNNWDYDCVKILSLYKKYKWLHTDVRKYYHLKD